MPWLSVGKIASEREGAGGPAHTESIEATRESTNTKLEYGRGEGRDGEGSERQNYNKATAG